MTTLEAASAGPTPAGAKYKRRLRNYLIDVGLQLRYTAAIVIVAVFLTSGLGYMIYQATRDTSKVITMRSLVDPDLATELDAQFASKDRTVLWGIIGFGAVLVLSVTGAGILITHKIAGPLFNIANIVAKVRDNRIGPSLRALRKGDELQEFYTGVREMHEALRRRADDDLRVLAQAIAALEGSDKNAANEAALQALRELRADKERSLQG